MDMDHLAETPPPRPSLHRRAHSDTTFRLDDLLLFDPSDLDLSSMELPRVSVDSPCVSEESEGMSLNRGVGEKKVRHRHSSSMDGSYDLHSDAFNKAMPPHDLSHLALIDPKRAKRILANRQSAARSKERKIRYTGELERKVQTLQTEATTLSAQLTLLQRDTTGLTAENKELKLRLQAMEQHAQLRDALNEKLREEVERLKIATSQIPAVNGSSFNSGMTPPFPPHHPAFRHSGIQPNPQQQQLYTSESSANTQTVHGQFHQNLPNCSQRA